MLVHVVVVALAWLVELRDQVELVPFWTVVGRFSVLVKLLVVCAARLTVFVFRYLHF